MGSVLNIWADSPADSARELTQLKSPFGNPIPRLEYRDDVLTGTSRPAPEIGSQITSLLFAAGQDGCTDAELVSKVFQISPHDSAYEAHRKKISRQIERWITQGQTAYERTDGIRDGHRNKIWRLKRDGRDYDDTAPIVKLDAERKKKQAQSDLAAIDAQIAARETRRNEG